MFNPIVKRPCPTCPFRRDVHMRLQPGRAEEIVQTLLLHSERGGAEWKGRIEIISLGSRLTRSRRAAGAVGESGLGRRKL
jgi:hypothetical protein